MTEAEAERISKTQSSKCPASCRLGTCEVCAANEARYCCPKCEVKTCSVPCVQIHKKELSCDGIRDRTKFIPLRKMTKMDFMSDYYFLEECTRYVEDRKTDRVKSFTRYNRDLPTHLHRLRRAAAHRGTVLRYLLQNFSRRKRNSTFYDWKLEKIFWRVEWIFLDAGNVHYVDKRCEEDKLLQHLLDKYVCVDSAEEVPEKKSLQCYQNVAVTALKVLLKAEGIKKSRTRFYALDVSKTLKENLSNKVLVEYPSIYVSYKTLPDGCDIIGYDEDVEKETNLYLENLNLKERGQRPEHNQKYNNKSDKKPSATLEPRRKLRQQKREELGKSSQNYLFTDERLWDLYTSSDESGSDEKN